MSAKVLLAAALICWADGRRLKKYMLSSQSSSMQSEDESGDFTAPGDIVDGASCLDPLWEAALKVCRKVGAPSVSGGAGTAYEGKSCVCPSGAEENIRRAKIVAFNKYMQTAKARKVEVVESEDTVTEATATCPGGSYVQTCESVPSQAQDGLTVSADGSKCTVTSSGEQVRARASCNDVPTTATSSGSLYEDGGVVSSKCPEGSNPISCTCKSQIGSVADMCNGESSFDPIPDDGDGLCERKVPSEEEHKVSHRRRNTGSGVGAKVYAVCQVKPKPVKPKPVELCEMEANASNEKSCCHLEDEKLAKAALKICKRFGSPTVSGNGISCDCPRRGR